VGYADYSTNPLGIYTNNGQGRYRGVEGAVHHDLTRNLTAALSATWLDAVYRQAGTAIIGNSIPGVSRYVAAASLTERVPWVQGLTLHADLQYVGRQWVNSANNWQVPSHTLLNLGASYVTRINGKDVTFRAEIDNVTDRKYWYASWTNSTAENTLQLGAPRVFSLNARIDF
jgi:iron complex outermembrane receptor protein